MVPVYDVHLQCLHLTAVTYYSIKTKQYVHKLVVTLCVGGGLDDLKQLVFKRDEVELLLVASRRLVASRADRHDALDLGCRPQNVRLVQRDRGRVVGQQSAVLKPASTSPW